MTTSSPEQNRDTVLGAVDVLIEELAQVLPTEAKEKAVQSAWKAVATELRASLLDLVERVATASQRKEVLEVLASARFEQEPGAARVSAVLLEASSKLDEEAARLIGKRCASAVRKFALQDLDVSLRGLALSGGGIRSAAFCLGVIQALARRGILRDFHYISGVSGGGYVASWLTTWAYRHKDGLAGVQRDLAKATSEGEEPEPIGWVRRYAIYLSPRFGPFAVDFWALVAAYIRNLTLHLLVVVPMIGLALSLSLVAVSLTQWWRNVETFTPLSRAIAVGVATLACMLGLRRAALFSLGDMRSILSKHVWWLASMSTIVAGLLTSASITPQLRTGIERFVGSDSRLALIGVVTASWMFLSLLSTFICWIGVAGGRIGASAGSAVQNCSWKKVMFASVVSGALSGGALGTFVVFFANSPLNTTGIAVLIGPTAFLGAIGLGEIAVAGVLGADVREEDRAWWARTAGEGIRAIVVWTSLTLVAIQLPEMLIGAWNYPSVGIWAAVALVLVALVGFFASKDRFMVLALTGGAIFLSLAALGTYLLATRWIPYGLAMTNIESAGPETAQVAASLAVLLMPLLFAKTASRFVNLNRFSLHAVYRDGLMRTFLGASRASLRNDSVVAPERILRTGEEGPQVRHPEYAQFQARNADAFTDFDEEDSPLLSWLRPDHRVETGSPSFPLLLLNASLNARSAGVRYGRLPRSHSFTFSPLHCGCPTTGYAPTRYVMKTHFRGGVSLAAAMAISGGAVSTQSGGSTRPTSSFLLMVANARLGWWLGNPGDVGTRGEIAPKSPFPYFRHELFGGQTTKMDWIHLSDGGHFDNLGVYELLRRGCFQIVAIDASADPNTSFGDLANLIRKAQVDFGVILELEAGWNISAKDTGHVGASCGSFRIRYPGRRGVGRMLYVKPAVYEGDTALPVDIVEYSKQFPEFPHQTTANQFFGSSQLEAYRRLGEHTIDRIAAMKPEGVGSVHELAFAGLEYSADAGARGVAITAEGLEKVIAGLNETISKGVVAATGTVKRDSQPAWKHWRRRRV